MFSLVTKELYVLPCNQGVLSFPENGACLSVTGGVSLYTQAAKFSERWFFQ